MRKIITKIALTPVVYFTTLVVVAAIELAIMGEVSAAPYGAASLLTLFVIWA